MWGRRCDLELDSGSLQASFTQEEMVSLVMCSVQKQLKERTSILYFDFKSF